MLIEMSLGALGDVAIQIENIHFRGLALAKKLLYQRNDASTFYFGRIGILKALPTLGMACALMMLNT